MEGGIGWSRGGVSWDGVGGDGVGMGWGGVEKVGMEWGGVMPSKRFVPRVESADRPRVITKIGWGLTFERITDIHTYIYT